MDHFPDVGGRKKIPEYRPKKILKEVNFQDLPGDKLKVFLNLFPLPIDQQVLKLNDRLSEGDKTTAGEWVVFLGLIIAARSRPEVGRGLWDTPVKECVFRGPSDFARFMTRNRFEILKSYAPILWEGAKDLNDPWYRFRPAVTAFNENRQRTINYSQVVTIDESMCAWKPRTTPTGGLPNISFIQRKPKPLGTEFKNSADGESGVMLFLEIQEGKKGMEHARFRDTMKANGACGLRLALGAIGK
jgi:hypothetical protein